MDLCYVEMMTNSPFDLNTRVKSGPIVAFLKAISGDFQSYMMEICLSNGIDLSNCRDEISLEVELAIYEEIERTVGSGTLHHLGRKVAEEVPIASFVRTLQELLAVGIAHAYQASHTGERIGHYRLLEYSMDKGFALLEAYNPYPGVFDSGLIYGLARRYMGPHQFNLDISIENRYPSREMGNSHSTVYRLTWDIF